MRQLDPIVSQYKTDSGSQWPRKGSVPPRTRNPEPGTGSILTRDFFQIFYWVKLQLYSITFLSKICQHPNHPMTSFWFWFILDFHWYSIKTALNLTLCQTKYSSLECKDPLVPGKRQPGDHLKVLCFFLFQMYKPQGKQTGFFFEQN